MGREKIFTCQECDENIEVEDVYNISTVACHNCGQEYRVVYVEQEEAYELIPIEPVEGRNQAEEEEDEPFRVLDEPGGLRDDDLERYR